MNLARIRKTTKDEAHEAYLRQCLDRVMDREMKWSEFVALLNLRSPEQVARMEAERGIGWGCEYKNQRQSDK